MKVLVCGGRDYTNRNHVFVSLDAVASEIDLIIEGGCRVYVPDVVGGGHPSGRLVNPYVSADLFAHQWAEERRKPVISHFADWDSFGKAAGPIRNKEMLEQWNPDVVIAFPGGKGTRNMVKQAKARGIRVEELPG